MKQSIKTGAMTTSILFIASTVICMEVSGQATDESFTILAQHKQEQGTRLNCFKDTALSWEKCSRLLGSRSRWTSVKCIRGSSP